MGKRVNESRTHRPKDQNRRVIKSITHSWKLGAAQRSPVRAARTPGLGGGWDWILAPILHLVINFRPIQSLRVENSIFKKLSLRRTSPETLYTLRPRKHFLVRLSTTFKEK